MSNRTWSEDELKQLAAIVAAGGTAFRAAAKFNRSMINCTNQARAIGTPFTPVSKMRRNIKAKCAAAEKALARGRRWLSRGATTRSRRSLEAIDHGKTRTVLS